MGITRRNFIRNLGGTTAAVAAGSGLVLAAPGQNRPLAKPRHLPAPSEDISWKLLRGSFKMNWTLEPAAGKWIKENTIADSVQGTYRSNGYILQIAVKENGKRSAIVQFNIRREDKAHFRMHAYKIACNTSQSGVYKIFTPGSMMQQNYQIDLPYDFIAHSRAEIDQPVIWMQQTDGANTFTLGLLDQVQCTTLRGTTYLGNEGGEAPGIANKYASVSLERIFDEHNEVTEFADGLYAEADADISWFQSLINYSKAADRFTGFDGRRKTSAWALNPAWSTWYAHASDINQEMLLEDARLARELGVTTIEIDAGWNTRKGVSYHLDEDGDYYFNKDRFPDPEKLINEMHLKGMKIILRVAPLVMGVNANSRKKLENCLLKVDGKPTTYLDPRLKPVEDFLLNAWEYLFSYYKIDGMFYDFLEIPEKPDPVKGAEILHDNVHTAYTHLMKKLYEKAIAIQPDAVIVLRRGSANLNAKSFCTHMWPQDVPQDYNMNRRDVLYLKSLGDGILTHACSTSWPVSESDINVARHMSSIVMAGVPFFASLLNLLTASHKRIIKAWLSFYEKNKRDLVMGKMKPLLPTPPSAVLYTKGVQQVFIGFFEAVTGMVEVENVNTITIINAYNNHTATRLQGLSGNWSLAVYDHAWEPAGSRQIKADEQQGVTLNVQTKTSCHVVVLKKM